MTSRIIEESWRTASRLLFRELSLEQWRMWFWYTSRWEFRMNTLLGSVSAGCTGYTESTEALSSQQQDNGTH